MADLALAPASAAPAPCRAPVPTAKADDGPFQRLMAKAAPADDAEPATSMRGQEDAETDADVSTNPTPIKDDGDPTTDPVLAALLMMTPPLASARPEPTATADLAAPATPAASAAIVAPTLSADPTIAAPQRSADGQAAAQAVLKMVEAGGAIVDSTATPKPAMAAAESKTMAATQAARAAEPPAPASERQTTASASDAIDRLLAKPARERTRSADAASTVTSADTPRAPAISTGPAAPAAPSPTDRALDHAIAGARDGQFLDQIARDIARIGASDSQLNFRLDPTNLAPLSIAIAQGSDGASVRMSSDDAHTRHVLAEAQPRLAAEARAQGLTLRETSVDVGDHRGGSRDQAAAWTAQDQSGSQRQAPRSSPDDKDFRVNAGPRPSERPATAAARYA